jgi:hypothetical protein
VIFTTISFLATLFIAGALLHKGRRPLRHAEHQLEEALGAKSGFGSTTEFLTIYWKCCRVFRMEINPDSIFSESDSPETRHLKQNYVEALKARGRTSRPALCGLLIGLSITLVISVLERLFE